MLDPAVDIVNLERKNRARSQRIAGSCTIHQSHGRKKCGTFMLDNFRKA